MEIPNRPQNLQANPKKRPSDCNVNIQDSTYFKIRAVLKDLRPHFLEVLRTPDFQTSKAAHEITQQMKVLMKLYKDMTTDTITMEKCKNGIDGVHDQKKPPPPEVKPAEPPQPPPVEKEKVVTRKASEELPTANKHHPEEVTPGSYIVGGSAFGWNFVTFLGGKLAAYYGRTKEDFRAANPIPDHPDIAES
ncbi:unnamed protein product [Lactuca virosa]|uniref:FRIGIDA-like protein n=1 Tax=Lactuca virosa TaxID=75947 RepID=A0AAU9LRZ4_9ASTR|nr:unnamed protein product [Lactuca virosa]